MQALIPLLLLALAGCSTYQLGDATSIEARVNETICDFTTERQRQAIDPELQVKCRQ